MELRAIHFATKNNLPNCEEQSAEGYNARGWKRLAHMFKKNQHSYGNTSRRDVKMRNDECGSKVDIGHMKGMYTVVGSY